MLALLLATSLQGSPDSAIFIRVNQVGYLPDGPKVAVACTLDSTAAARLTTFAVQDLNGRIVYGPQRVTPAGSFGPCVVTHRLDFTGLTRGGRYRVVAAGAVSPVVRIDTRAYAGAADTLLYYMRQQRSGFNPFFKDSVHRRDGLVVDDSALAGRFVPVSGGWADAGDYLQYVATSAHATYMMLMAYRDHPTAFDDEFDARGLVGRNGVPDVLDEARHGLVWLLRMFPNDTLLFNQLGDDRDHAFLDLPTTDSSDYGWGKGKERPVYPCTGRPQGLFQHKNRSTGKASTAGKYASAFALGAQIFARRDSAFSSVLRRKARAAFRIGIRYPGVCQTAPARAPYFYEEDNWHDDMELAAAQLGHMTGELHYFGTALMHARQEPMTLWMGADTARHYQWFPWHNNGHYEVWRSTRLTASERAQMTAFYRQGLASVVARAKNGFRIGIPFIWCSNNLVASFATQAYLYRRMTGDQRFRSYEAAALDWLFGTNPWGTSMVIGYPRRGVWARNPHSVVAMQYGPESQTGGLLDGPVYRSIFQNLRGIHLRQADEYARFNTGFIVYHDDEGDYSTNEPIMDGTANLTYLLAAMVNEAARRPR
jgi:hypothetical protein